MRAGRATRIACGWTSGSGSPPLRRMAMELETFGNAVVQVRNGDDVILTTDPWLVGTCYFGSWGMDKPVTPVQIRNAQRSRYVWISHGHPDHLHPESLALLPKRTTRILLPDHYDGEIARALRGEGFDVTVLPFKKWVPLTADVQVLCLDNENQDGILVIRAGDSLLLDLNDSPLCGEGEFLRRLVRDHENDKTYLLALCAIDADMLNLVDEEGRSIAGPPEMRKPGAIWDVAARAASLGVKNFCCSSSQHIYVRADSRWANPYRITWQDMLQHWSRPEVRLIEPYATVDLDTGWVTANHPTHESDWSQVGEGTGDDDWNARLSEEEWGRVAAFMRKFEIIRDRIDFVEFTVGGERRRVVLDPSKPLGERPRGINFFVPRQSLLATIEYGYFDDLLIGNFMKTQLIDAKLYPDFSKQVAKLGGNAKVFTKEELRRFRRRYFRRSPRAYLAQRLTEAWIYEVLPRTREASERLGLKPMLKKVYRRWIRRDPVPALGS